MTRLTLALLLGLSMLVSLSAHAGGRDGHHGKHHRHHNKHQRHYANHHRRPHARGHRCHAYRGDGRYHHGANAQSYYAPRFEFGASYGPSGIDTVIVYQDRGGRY